jgi:hypothetical protein
VPADIPVPPGPEWTRETPGILRDAMLRSLDGWHPNLRGLAERPGEPGEVIDATAASEHAMREYAYPLMRTTVQHDEYFGAGGLKDLSREVAVPD